ncbi:MAG: hypothetical protein ACLRZ9_00615 [Eubacterium sp.]
MIISKRLEDAEFIMSKDELTYSAVIEDFKNASQIHILTYNISKDQNVLLKALKDYEDDTEICYQYLELLKRVNKIFDLRVFYEKGVDNLDTVIEEASHMIENMEMLFTGNVYDLAKFDEQDFVDEYLSECYAEAYDEKLDYYIDKAMSAASNAFAELAEEAKDEADMLLRQIEE